MGTQPGHGPHSGLAVEPPVTPSARRCCSATRKRPDFRVSGGTRPFYLEATVVTYNQNERAQRQRENLLVDLVNNAFDADFLRGDRRSGRRTHHPKASDENHSRGAPDARDSQDRISGGTSAPQLSPSGAVQSLNVEP